MYLNLQITNIPVIIAFFVFILNVNGFIKLSPLIESFMFIFMVVFFMFLMTANIITGGYKNDVHRNKEFGEQWREILIAIVPLCGIISLIIYEGTYGTVVSLVEKFITIIICIVLSYLIVKLRYRIFSILTPEEKEVPISFNDFKKYFRWYHWLLSFTVFIILLGLFLGQN